MFGLGLRRCFIDSGNRNWVCKMCSRCFLQLFSYILCFIRELTAERRNIMRGERREDGHSISQISNKSVLIWLMYMEKSYVCQWHAVTSEEPSTIKWGLSRQKCLHVGTTGRRKLGGKYWSWIHLRWSSANRAELYWVIKVCRHGILQERRQVDMTFMRGRSGIQGCSSTREWILFTEWLRRETFKPAALGLTSTSSPTVSKHCFRY